VVYLGPCTPGYLHTIQVTFYKTAICAELRGALLQGIPWPSVISKTGLEWARMVWEWNLNLRRLA